MLAPNSHKTPPYVVAAMVAYLAWYVRFDVLSHNEYMGAPGEDDPEKGIGRFVKRFFTGNPDKGGVRFSTYLPTGLFPATEYYERFLARVFTSFIVRVIAYGIHRDRDKPSGRYKPSRELLLPGSFANSSQNSHIANGSDDLSDLLEISDKKMNTLILLRQMKLSSDECGNILAGFGSLMAQDPIYGGERSWHQRMNRATTDAALHKIIRLTVRYLNKTGCVNAVVIFKQGSARTRSKAGNANVGGPLALGTGNMINVGAAYGQSESKTRYAKIPDGIHIQWYNRDRIEHRIAQIDTRMASEIRQYPNALGRLVDTVREHMTTAVTTLGLAFIGGQLTNNIQQTPLVTKVLNLSKKFGALSKSK